MIEVMKGIERVKAKIIYGGRVDPKYTGLRCRVISQRVNDDGEVEITVDCGGVTETLPLSFREWESCSEIEVDEQDSPVWGAVAV